MLPIEADDSETETARRGFRDAHASFDRDLGAASYFAPDAVRSRLNIIDTLRFIAPKDQNLDL